MDSIQDAVDKIRDEHNVGAVAAQNVVDHNNPAWTALREAARNRFDALQDEPQFLILSLCQKTGKLAIETDPNNSRALTLSPGADPVMVHSPLVIHGMDAAHAWVKLHANPDVVRYMIVEAIDDTVHPVVDLREVPSEEERDAFLVSAGYRFDTEQAIWVGPKMTFDRDYIANTSWGEIRKLLFGK